MPKLREQRPYRRSGAHGAHQSHGARPSRWWCRYSTADVGAELLTRAIVRVSESRGTPRARRPRRERHRESNGAVDRRARRACQSSMKARGVRPDVDVRAWSRLSRAFFDSARCRGRMSGSECRLDYRGMYASRAVTYDLRYSPDFVRVTRTRVGAWRCLPGLPTVSRRSSATNAWLASRFAMRNMHLMRVVAVSISYAADTITRKIQGRPRRDIESVVAVHLRFATAPRKGIRDRASPTVEDPSNDKPIDDWRSRRGTRADCRGSSTSQGVYRAFSGRATPRHEQIPAWRRPLHAGSHQLAIIASSLRFQQCITESFGRPRRSHHRHRGWTLRPSASTDTHRPASIWR